MRNYDFIHSKLIGSDFNNTELSRVIFHQADLRKADFSSTLGYKYKPTSEQH